MTIINTVLIAISILAGLVLLVAFVFSKEVEATKDKDPAAMGYLQIILMYPGLHALILHRIAHYLWKRNLPFLARGLSFIGRFLTGIEIHPGAQIGHGFFIDHGMGVVIGETSIIGDNVTLFQGVTLGGTGKEKGKRHPTIKNNVVIGAGAKVLGDITIGSNSYVGANAVVLHSMPHNSTIVGVPGRVTKQDGKKIDKNMDHIKILDPLTQSLDELSKRIDELEQRRS
jgi:serine O-acetyltransferase